MLPSDGFNSHISFVWKMMMPKRKRDYFLVRLKMCDLPGGPLQLNSESFPIHFLRHQEIKFGFRIILEENTQTLKRL